MQSKRKNKPILSKPDIAGRPIDVRVRATRRAKKDSPPAEALEVTADDPSQLSAADVETAADSDEASETPRFGRPSQDDDSCSLSALVVSRQRDDHSAAPPEAWFWDRTRNAREASRAALHISDAARICGASVKVDAMAAMYEQEMLERLSEELEEVTRGPFDPTVWEAVHELIADMTDNRMKVERLRALVRSPDAARPNTAALPPERLANIARLVRQAIGVPGGEQDSTEQPSNSDGPAEVVNDAGRSYDC